MADQSSTVIIDVNLNSEQARERATALSYRIVELRDQQDLLRRAGLQLGNTYRENAQDLRQLESETRAYINISRNQEGSVNSLRAQITILNNQFNAMSRAERDGTEAGRALTRQLEALRAEERSVSQGVGNFSTNIGNYTQSILQATGVTGGFGGQLSAVASNFNSLQGAFAGVSSALGVFRTALLSSGIGAVIIAVASLGTYLKDLDTVTDNSAVLISNLKARFQELGRSILDLDFKNLFKNMQQAGLLAASLAEQNQELEDSLTSQALKSANAQAEVAKLRAEALNRALSPAVRQKLLAQAEQIDADDLAAKKKLNDRSIEYAILDIERTGNLKKEQRKELRERGLDYAIYLQNNLTTQGKVTDEQTKNLQKALLNQTQIQNEFTQRSERRNNLSERLAMQEEARQKALADKLNGINEDRIKSELYTASSILTIRQKEFQDINADIDKRVRLYRQYGQDTTQLERERLVRLNELQRKFTTQDQGTIRGNVRSAAQTRAAGIADPEARKQAQLDNQSIFDLEDIDRQISAVAARIALGEQGLGELIQSYADKRTAIVDKSNADQERLQEEHDERIRELQQNGLADYNQGLLTQIEFEREQNEARLQMNQELANSFGSLAGDIAGAFGKQTALGKIAIAAQKAFAIAEILINSERQKAAIAARYAILELQAAAIPFAGIGIIAGLKVAEAVELGAVTAREIGSIASVIATSIGSFADGGRITGAGTGKSDSIIARVSNGESVINANSTKMFAPLLSAINVAGGGAAFADGGVAGSYIPTLAKAAKNQFLMGDIMKGWRPTVYVEDINYKQNQNAVNVENANF